jgi:type II secretory ATPase GspE/PulE/Tfp pilus assembly ATPase PilB-like protein
MKKLITTVSTLLLLGIGLNAQAGQDKAQEVSAKKSDAEVIKEQAPSYPLTTCPVSGEGLDAMGSPVDFVADGRLIRVCCKSCIKTVSRDASEAIAKIDAAVIAEQKASYPLATCPVSGEKLGSMGDALDLVHGTRLVRVCCKNCIKSFEKDPAATMAKIDAALIEAQVASYPSKTCPVSKQELGSMGDPIDLLYGTKLVRLCCKGCTKKFHANPEKTVAAIYGDGKAKDKKGI